MFLHPLLCVGHSFHAFIVTLHFVFVDFPCLFLSEFCWIWFLLIQFVVCFLKLVDVFSQPSILLVIACWFSQLLRLLFDLLSFTLLWYSEKNCYHLTKGSCVRVKEWFERKKKKKMSSFCVYISENNYFIGDNNPAEPVFKKQRPISSIPAKVMLLIFYPRSYFVN